MLLDELCTRLAAAAKDNGWPVERRDDLTAPSFRGSGDTTNVSLPANARGLQLGLYAVIAVPLRLESAASVEDDLKAAHNQMIIARSYLSNAQVIDAHIIFVAEGKSDDWKQHVDRIQRDEATCRKLVWMPDRQDFDRSFAEFVDCSFLARPWLVAIARDAPLDQNQELVETVLREQGLSEGAAKAWVELAASRIDDPEQLVERLVEAMEMPT
ncbi:ABC-three component system middle component 1 [Rhizobium laguerreae]|uniref:ABC-three component system middle component 1 n=1 Tax=Rhizobium laguerreae TaxID=1076926 RepID=UPI001C91AB94|nr:ABC-three component system middle component 1 [Rhizobium laguerreae]MBY3211770.1 hypothetical protein [Rhizobium laguerreae]